MMREVEAGKVIRGRGREGDVRSGESGGSRK